MTIFAINRWKECNIWQLLNEEICDQSSRNDRRVFPTTNNLGIVEIRFVACVLNIPIDEWNKIGEQNKCGVMVHGVMVDCGVSPSSGRVMPMTMKLLFAASPLST